MGTGYSILSYQELEPFQEEIEEELERVENIFSTYRENSELVRFNETYQWNQEFPISDELSEIWRLSQKLKKDSGGAFSVEIGRSVDAWGFGARKKDRPLRKEIREKIRTCRKSVEFQLLPNQPPPQPQNSNQNSNRNSSLYPSQNPSQNPFRLLPVLRDASGICKQKNIRPALDFSGIAKGYGIDRLRILLTRKSVESYMIEIGGDVCVRSTNGRKWNIGIRDPGNPHHIQKIIPLENGCVATSGNAHQRIQESGKTVTHILDPRKGLPIEKEISSVSVVYRWKGEPRVRYPGALVDAWATALFVLGESGAKDDWEGLEYYFLTGNSP